MPLYTGPNSSHHSAVASSELVDDLHNDGKLRPYFTERSHMSRNVATSFFSPSLAEVLIKYLATCVADVSQCSVCVCVCVCVCVWGGAFGSMCELY